MKTVFTAPVWWAREAVGSKTRFWCFVAFQLSGIVFFGRAASWQQMATFVCFGALMPLCYLFSLRGCVRELQAVGGFDHGKV